MPRQLARRARCADPRRRAPAWQGAVAALARVGHAARAVVSPPVAPWRFASARRGRRSSAHLLLLGMSPRHPLRFLMSISDAGVDRPVLSPALLRWRGRGCLASDARERTYGSMLAACEPSCGGVEP